MLQQFFTDNEIRSFSDLGIHNFENAVKSMASIGHPDMSVREFILSTILANRVPLLELHTNHSGYNETAEKQR